METGASGGEGGMESEQLVITHNKEQTGAPLRSNNSPHVYSAAL